MIKLKTLDLENFMSSSEAHLDFTDQKVILLMGDNGNGKSSILDAIALCLNGYHRGSTFGEYIKRRQKEAHVKLTGELGGFPITFTVTVLKKGLERKVVYEQPNEKGEFQIYNNSDIDGFLKKFEMDFYADLIMSMQGSDDDIVKLKPAGRAEKLRKLLNRTYATQMSFVDNQLSDLKKQIEHSNDIININTKTIEIKKSQIRFIPEDTFTNRISDLSKASETIKLALTKYQGLNEKQQNLTVKLNSTLQEKYKLTNKISTLETNLSKLPSLKETLTKYNTDMASLSEKAAENLSKSTELNNSLLTINTELSELENKKSKVITDLATAKAELISVQKHISLIDAGKCPECGHEFTSQDKEIYEKQLIGVNSRIESLTNQQNDLIAKITSSRSLYTTTSTDVTNISKEVNLINNELSSIRTNKPQIEEQITYLEGQATDEVVKSKQDLDLLNNEENSLKQEQNNLVSALKEYENLNNDLRAAQQEISSLNQQLLIRNNIIQNNNNITLEIDNLTKAIEEQNTLIENYHRDEAVYKEVYSLLKELRDYAVIKACAKLEQEMNDFIKIVFPDMYVRLFQNKAGVEFFYTTEKQESYNKEDLSNAAMASGFERATLSIAVKVALCKAYNLPFAFFDEADEKGSDTNAAKLFKSLLTNGLFDQVFIISQKDLVRETIKNEVDGVRTYYARHGNFTLEGDY